MTHLHTAEILPHRRPVILHLAHPPRQLLHRDRLQSLIIDIVHDFAQIIDTPRPRLQRLIQHPPIVPLVSPCQNPPNLRRRRNLIRILRQLRRFKQSNPQMIIHRLQVAFQLLHQRITYRRTTLTGTFQLHRRQRLLDLLTPPPQHRRLPRELRQIIPNCTPFRTTRLHRPTQLVQIVRQSRIHTNQLRFQQRLLNIQTSQLALQHRAALFDQLGGAGLRRQLRVQPLIDSVEHIIKDPLTLPRQIVQSVLQDLVLALHPRLRRPKRHTPTLQRIHGCLTLHLITDDMHVTIHDLPQIPLKQLLRLIPQLCNRDLPHLLHNRQLLRMVLLPQQFNTPKLVPTAHIVTGTRRTGTTLPRNPHRVNLAALKLGMKHPRNIHIVQQSTQPRSVLRPRQMIRHCMNVVPPLPVLRPQLQFLRIVDILRPPRPLLIINP